MCLKESKRMPFLGLPSPIQDRKTFRVAFYDRCMLRCFFFYKDLPILQLPKQEFGDKDQTKLGRWVGKGRSPSIWGRANIPSKIKKNNGGNKYTEPWPKERFWLTSEPSLREWKKEFFVKKKNVLLLRRKKSSEEDDGWNEATARKANPSERGPPVVGHTTR